MIRFAYLSETETLVNFLVENYSDLTRSDINKGIDLAIEQLEGAKV